MQGMGWRIGRKTEGMEEISREGREQEGIQWKGNGMAWNARELEGLERIEWKGIGNKGELNGRVWNGRE